MDVNGWFDPAAELVTRHGEVRPTQGKGHIVMTEHKAEYEAKIGMTIFPGTIDAYLQELEFALIQPPQLLEPDEFLRADREVRKIACKVNGVPGYILRANPGEFEIVCSERVPGVEYGKTVEIVFENKSA